MDRTKTPEGTRLSRELLEKQGSLVRVVGLQPVFVDTATVAAAPEVVAPAPQPAPATQRSSGQGES